VMKRVIY